MRITREHLLQIEGQTYYLRLLALLLIFALIYWTGGPNLTIWLVVSTGVGYLVYTIALHYLIPGRLFNRYLVMAMMAVDWAFSGAVLYLLGIGSVAFLLVPLLVINHAMYLGYVGSLVSASVMALMSVGQVLYWGDPEAVSLVAFRIPLLYIVALFTGYMAQQRVRERDAKLALQEALRAEQGARDLVNVAQELHQDPNSMLLSVAATAVGVTGARQCVVFLRDETGDHLEGRVAFPQVVEGGVSLVDTLQEPLTGRWLERLGQEETAITLAGDELPSWAGLAAGGKLVALRLAVSGTTVGAIYCIPAEYQTTEDLEKLASGIAPLAAAALADVERYARTRRQAEDLLRGLQGAVQRMGRVRESQSRRELTRGGLALNPGRSQATLDGAVLPLSPTEFDVLYYLAERAGQTVNQAMLQKEVWVDHGETHSNVVDVCVHRLRHKLAKHPGGSGLIVTARGAGYMFRTR